MQNRLHFAFQAVVSLAKLQGLLSAFKCHDDFDNKTWQEMA
jgi:hypothetical protein